MTKILASLPLRTPFSQYNSFRFHDLPQELQDMIYEYVYAEGYSVAVHMTDQRLVCSHQRYYDEDDNTIEDDGLGIKNWTGSSRADLALVSKRVREESRPIRQAAFNRHMRVTFDASLYRNSP